MLFKASAAGSLMLLGEYAVLHEKQALVCAVDKRITVTLIPRPDTIISIDSNLGFLSFDLSELSVQSPFQYVLQVLLQFKSRLKIGCDITIESEFSHEVGLGSSAAVTVAMLGVLNQWLALDLTTDQLIKTAGDLIRQVQGVGSGADAAASVLGGIVAFSTKPFLAEKLPHLFPITVVYSGSKTPTPKAIQQVRDYFSKEPENFLTILNKIQECVTLGIKSVRQQNEIELGRAMNAQQIQMEALGVSTDALKNKIAILSQYENIKGVKISGAGLGDCVVGLGALSETLSMQLPITMSSTGLRYE